MAPDTYHILQVV